MRRERRSTRLHANGSSTKQHGRTFPPTRRRPRHRRATRHLWTPGAWGSSVHRGGQVQIQALRRREDLGANAEGAALLFGEGNGFCPYLSIHYTFWWGASSLLGGSCCVGTVYVVLFGSRRFVSFPVLRWFGMLSCRSDAPNGRVVIRAVCSPPSGVFVRDFVMEGRRGRQVNLSGNAGTMLS